MSSYIKEEVYKSKYIKEEYRESVFNMVSEHQIKPKDEDLLSLEEKKEKGLNTRMKISRVHLEMITDTALGDYENPRDVFAMLHNRASIRCLRAYNYEKLRDIEGVKYYMVNGASGAKKVCSWCASMNGKKLPIAENYPKLVDTNCSCAPYSYTTTRIYIEGFS